MKVPTQSRHSKIVMALKIFILREGWPLACALRSLAFFHDLIEKKVRHRIQNAYLRYMNRCSGTLRQNAIQ